MKRTTKPKLPQETGEQLKRKIIALAEMSGWLVFSAAKGRRGAKFCTPHDSRTSKGFPDLFMLCPRPGSRPLALECKGQHEAVSEEQRNWIARLDERGVNAHVVRPDDWHWIEAIFVTGRRRTLLAQAGVGGGRG